MISSGSGGISERLRHLAPALVADDAGEEDIAERNLAVNSRPAMIMRATQKKMMSGPVTSTFVG